MKLTATHEANIRFHNELGRRYEEQPFYSEENRARVKRVLLQLKDATSGERLLDVGCGSGFIIDLAHDLFHYVDGLDVTAEMLDKVQRRENVRLELGLAEAIPFADKQFDAVTCYSVLHHIEEPAAVFREVRRVLKPGGVFYADESPSQDYRDALSNMGPARSSTLGQEYDRVFGDLQRYEGTYNISRKTVEAAMVQNYGRHQLSEETLRSALHAAGFTEVEITFRRFIGEDWVATRGGPEGKDLVGDYLRSLLPLTRHLFKYFVLVAK